MREALGIGLIVLGAILVGIGLGYTIVNALAAGLNP